MGSVPSTKIVIGLVRVFVGSPVPIDEFREIVNVCRFHLRFQITAGGLSPARNARKKQQGRHKRSNASRGHDGGNSNLCYAVHLA